MTTNRLPQLRKLLMLLPVLSPLMAHHFLGVLVGAADDLEASSSSSLYDYIARGERQHQPSPITVVGGDGGEEKYDDDEGGFLSSYSNSGDDEDEKNSATGRATAEGRRVRGVAVGGRRNHGHQNDRVSRFQHSPLGLHGVTVAASASTATARRSRRRDLKGSKSGSGSGSCEKLYYRVNKADVVANLNNLNFGYTLQVTAYQQASAATTTTATGKKKIQQQKTATWYENVFFTDPTGISTDTFSGRRGSGTVMLVLNKNTALSLAVAMNQRQLPITGGTGQYYRCPSGYARKVKQNASGIIWMFYVCQTC